MLTFQEKKKLKSISRGYASFDYERIDSQSGDLVKLDIRLAGDVVDALSIIIHRNNAYKLGASLCKKLKEEIWNQLFRGKKQEKHTHGKRWKKLLKTKRKLREL